MGERGREQRNRPKESPTATRIKNWQSDLDYLSSNTILHKGDLRGDQPQVLGNIS